MHIMNLGTPCVGNLKKEHVRDMTSSIFKEMYTINYGGG